MISPSSELIMGVAISTAVCLGAISETSPLDSGGKCQHPRDKKTRKGTCKQKLSPTSLEGFQIMS